MPMRFAARLLCAILSLSPTLAAAQSFGDLQVVEGMDALHRGDDAQALMLLAPVVDRVNYADLRSCDEICSEARFVAAQATGNLGLHEQTLLYLKGLETALPEVADFIFAQRARTLRSQGRWAEAYTVWKLIQDKFPQSPMQAEAAYSMADALYAQDQLDRAYAAYDVAQRTYPKSDRALIARYTMGRIEETRHHLAAAAALYHPLTVGSSGLMAVPAAGRLENLVQQRVAASVVTAGQKLARIDRLIASRALDDAEAALTALTKLTPPPPLPRTALDQRRAQLAYRRQHFADAITIYKQLVQGSAGRAKLDFQRALAASYSASSQFPAAVAIFRDIAAHYRGAHDGREAQFRAAWLAYDGGDHALAIKLFDEFVTTYPTDKMADEATWYMAWNAYRMGDLPKASEVLERLRTQFKRSPLADRTYYWQGRIATQLGQRDAAVDFYKKAARRPNTYYGFLALERLGELDHGGPQPPQWQNGALVASLATPPIATTEDAARPETLPDPVELKPASDDSMPWGNPTFDWSGPDGRRALRLMKVGLRREAARLVTSLPVLPGISRPTAAYGRARLLYGLGDFAAAYRLVSSNFRGELDQVPVAHTRRYLQIAYPDAHAELVTAASREFHISPLLVLAIMRQESAFDDQADSWASARGLMQIIPITGRRIAEVLRLDPYNDGVLREPVVNVRFGTWYLAQLVQKFEGNFVLAIGSYNAGPQAMQRWVDSRAGCATDEFIEDIPYRETRHYVKNVLSNLAVYAELYGHQGYQVPASVAASYRDNVNF